MFELKNELIKPLIGKIRCYKSHTIKALLWENENMCPKCGEVSNINANKITDENYDKLNFEIAHIYGLKNFKTLKYPNKFHIAKIEEINSYRNLILLCRECHRKYDNPPTYEKYKEMLELKKKLNLRYTVDEMIKIELSMLWDKKEELEKLQNLKYIEDFKMPKKYIEKLEDNKISQMKQKSLKTNLTNFNLQIMNFFEDFDSELGELILNINGNMYSVLKNKFSKEEILNIMVRKNSEIMNLSPELQTAIVNYCIYKCDVLDKK